MKDKIERTVEQVEGKVFAVTKTEKLTDDNRVTYKILGDEMSHKQIETYLSEDAEQMVRYEKQEKENSEKIQEIEKRLSELNSDDLYARYVENFPKYELFEKLIELDVKPEILNEELRTSLELYKTFRDTKEYKNYYVTYTDQQGLDALYQNVEAYKDIKEEREMFLDQMIKCKWLLE